MYTVGELKQALEDLPDDAPLFVAHQSSYPLVARLSAVVTPEDLNDARREELLEDYLARDIELNDAIARVDEDLADEDSGEFPNNAVWLRMTDGAEGGHPYAPNAIFEVC